MGQPDGARPSPLAGGSRSSTRPSPTARRGLRPQQARANRPRARHRARGVPDNRVAKNGSHPTRETGTTGHGPSPHVTSERWPHASGGNGAIRTTYTAGSRRRRLQRSRCPRPRRAGAHPRGRAKDRGKRQPAPDQPVSSRQTGGLLSSQPPVLPPQTAMEPPVAQGSPPSMASAPLLPSPGKGPRSQKRAKDHGKRQPASDQPVSGKQTSGLFFSRPSTLPPHPATEPPLLSTAHQAWPPRPSCPRRGARSSAPRTAASGTKLTVSRKAANRRPASFLRGIRFCRLTSAQPGDLKISGKYHPRPAAMLQPSVAPKLHPAALSLEDAAPFPTSPGAAEGSEIGHPTPSDPQAEG